MLQNKELASVGQFHICKLRFKQLCIKLSSCNNTSDKVKWPLKQYYHM